MSPDVSNPAARELTYDDLLAAYSEQIDGLIAGGVDALLIETIFDTLNAKVAIDAAMTVMQHYGVELPVMLSVTVSDLAGRTLSGQTLEAFLASISSYPVFSVGLNCSFGARQMKPFLEQMSSERLIQEWWRFSKSKYVSASSESMVVVAERLWRSIRPQPERTRINKARVAID